MSSQLIWIVVLAGVALFLVLQLRQVLGTRDGFEPQQDATPANAERPSGQRDFSVIDGGAEDTDISAHTDPDGEVAKVLAMMKLREPSFSVTEFTGGARQAYEMILMAFENGDLDTLGNFLSDDVFDSFSGVIKQREADGLKIEAEFVGVREVKLYNATLDEATGEGEITMKFIGELTSVVRNTDGEIVEGDPSEIKRQRDVWTFSRVIGSDDPNWQLVATAV